MSQLRAVGAELLNIHGQHEGARLLDEERHGEYLDRYGRTERVLSAYQKEYEALLAIRRRMGELQMDEAEKARRMDSLRFQIDELERADLRPGEDEELRARRDFLRSGEKYLSALEGAAYALGGGDDSDGAARQLQSAAEALTPLRSLGGEFAELCERVQEAAAEVYDLSETLRDKREEFDFSPGELDAVESRCDQLYRLKKKYGATAEDMLAYLDRCRRELDTIETSEEELARLERKLATAEGKVRAAGEALTAARKAAAEGWRRMRTSARKHPAHAPNSAPNTAPTPNMKGAPNTAPTMAPTMPAHVEPLEDPYFLAPQICAPNSTSSPAMARPMNRTKNISPRPLPGTSSAQATTRATMAQLPGRVTRLSRTQMPRARRKRAVRKMLMPLFRG